MPAQPSTYGVRPYGAVEVPTAASTVAAAGPESNAIFANNNSNNGVSRPSRRVVLLSTALLVCVCFVYVAVASPSAAEDSMKPIHSSLHENDNDSEFVSQQQQEEMQQIEQDNKNAAKLMLPDQWQQLALAPAGNNNGNNPPPPPITTPAAQQQLAAQPPAQISETEACEHAKNRLSLATESVLLAQAGDGEANLQDADNLQMAAVREVSRICGQFGPGKLPDTLPAAVLDAMDKK